MEFIGFLLEFVSHLDKKKWLMDVDGVVPCIESIEHGIQAIGGGDRRHQRRVPSSEFHSQPVMMTIHATGLSTLL